MSPKTEVLSVDWIFLVLKEDPMSTDKSKVTYFEAELPLKWAKFKKKILNKYNLKGFLNAMIKCLSKTRENRLPKSRDFDPHLSFCEERSGQKTIS